MFKFDLKCVAVQVAAGMKAELKVQIYAIAVGVEGGQGVGSISHNVEIITETDHLYLPVKAKVMTVHEYDQQGVRSLAPGVAYLTSKPPTTQSIVRPQRGSLGKCTNQKRKCLVCTNLNHDRHC